MADAAEVARAASRPPSAPRAIDLLVDGLGLRFTDGYLASVSVLQRAVAAFGDEHVLHGQDLRWPWLAARTAADLFDEESWNLLASARAQFIRDSGALTMLPIVLSYLADLRVLEGKLDAAATFVEESRSLVEATGGRRIPAGQLLLVAYRGDDGAEQLIAQAERDATARGEGMVLTFAERARAVLGNGRGRYAAALAAAQRASDQDELSVPTRTLAELVEAAVRSGSAVVAGDAIDRLSERTQAVASESALGIEARSRALVSEGEDAQSLYREAIERLGRSRLAAELARAHLLYGEWLRREQRRTEARAQLRQAYEMFTEMGAAPFAERAARELVATGETARKRTPETRDELTPHEARIARMARDGASNQQIATELFVSRKTVEYHLHKVFQKLAISRREQLARALRG
jgi:ATP/maltotriose-dependent transcriptional regulator MalT